MARKPRRPACRAKLRLDHRVLKQKARVMIRGLFIKRAAIRCVDRDFLYWRPGQIFVVRGLGLAVAEHRCGLALYFRLASLVGPIDWDSGDYSVGFDYFPYALLGYKCEGFSPSPSTVLQLTAHSFCCVSLDIQAFQSFRNCH